VDVLLVNNKGFDIIAFECMAGNFRFQYTHHEAFLNLYYLKYRNINHSLIIN
jgi:hypothetical protein